MTRIPVFYDPRMAAATDSVSPSTLKPKLVYEDWLKSLPDKIETIAFRPLTAEQLEFAHDYRYVRRILAGKTENGFGNRDKQIAESLLWTNASFAYAALHVLEHGGFACSPTSGFHHAMYDESGSFCTFNGLVIAAQMVTDTSDVQVGILDMDYHFGDGTANIIERLGLEFSQVSGWRDCSPTKVLDEIPNYIDSLEADLLFYQAGADMHKDDPLGGIFTTDQLRERDHIVFSECRKRNLPCVWNLAGGYQRETDGSIPKVLEIHRNTMQECIAVGQS